MSFAVKSRPAVGVPSVAKNPGPIHVNLASRLAAWVRAIRLPPPACNEEMRSGGGRLDLLRGTHFGEQMPQHGFIMLLFAQLKRRLQDAFGAEARVQRDKPAEAPAEKSAGDQYQGYRNLDHHKQALKAEPATMRGEAAAGGFHRLGCLTSCRAKCRRHAQEKAGDTSKRVPRKPTANIRCTVPVTRGPPNACCTIGAQNELA